MLISGKIGGVIVRSRVPYLILQAKSQGHDITHKDIAESIGVSANTVTQWTQLGRDMSKSYIGTAVSLSLYFNQFFPCKIDDVIDIQFVGK